MENNTITVRLLALHQCLLNFFGHLLWWPGDSDLEIMIGAILTQNTNWQNVIKVIKKMKEEELLDVKALFYSDEKYLGQLIKSCGYYNLKAKRLKNFIFFFHQKYNGSTERMFNWDWQLLRKELLAVNGIGPETADSILLYAGRKPVFVVDAYTLRIFQRHEHISSGDSYEQVQQYFMRSLPQDCGLYNEFHAQIVMVGKNYCKRRNPNCRECPLSEFLK